jgi:hypothetical protein
VPYQQVASRCLLSNSPAVIGAARRKAAGCSIAFFTANIRNPDTRAAYAHAVAAFYALSEERCYASCA